MRPSGRDGRRHDDNIGPRGLTRHHRPPRLRPARWAWWGVGAAAFGLAGNFIAGHGSLTTPAPPRCSPSRPRSAQHIGTLLGMASFVCLVLLAAGWRRWAGTAVGPRRAGGRPGAHRHGHPGPVRRPDCAGRWPSTSRAGSTTTTSPTRGSSSLHAPRHRAVVRLVGRLLTAALCRPACPSARGWCRAGSAPSACSALVPPLGVMAGSAPSPVPASSRRSGWRSPP